MKKLGRLLLSSDVLIGEYFWDHAAAKRAAKEAGKRFYSLSNRTKAFVYNAETDEFVGFVCEVQKVRAA